MSKGNTNILGDKLSSFRQNQQLTLNTVATAVDIDKAILSKIERGIRKPTRPQIVSLAKYYGVSEKELLIEWLSDKILYCVQDEDIALESIKLAEEKAIYLQPKKTKLPALVKQLKIVLAKDDRVANAWIFGSVARGDENSDSDVDLIVEFNNKKAYSLFDILDIAYILEQKIKRKFDIVEKGYLRDFALKSALNEIIPVYG